MTNHKVSYQRWSTYQGKEVFLFKIQNENGSFVELTNYGATLVAVVVPDRLGKHGNVILGFNSLEGYLQDRCYIGSTIGRFANRISNASFELDGETFVLEKNDVVNTNHGGFDGFNNKVFDLDRKTVVNFTSHAYFNLSSEPFGISSHQLQISADKILETNASYLPTGKVIPAENATFKGQKIEDCLADTGLYALNTFYIFEALAPDENVARLSHTASVRKLEIQTSYPGLMLYTGNYLTSTLPGYHLVPYQPFDGLCLECQGFPDSPNHAHFPSTVLNPGEQYHQYIHFKFSINKESADFLITNEQTG